MRPVLLATAIIVLFASAATLARADNANLLDEARSLFAAGDYLPAADKARAAGGAEGLAMATQYTCY